MSLFHHLQKHAFEIIKPLKQKSSMQVFLCRKENNPYVIKVSDDATLFSRIEAEVAFNTFMRKNLPANTSFTYPSASLITNPTYRIGVFEYIEGTPFASQGPDKIVITPSEKDFEIIFKATSFLHTIPKETVPTQFSAHAPTHAQYIEKMKQYLAPAIEHKLIDKSQTDRLTSLYTNLPFHTRFLHHDMMLPNMIQKENGDIAFIDAEFARIGMMYYDIAYFYLQTNILFNAPDIAKQFLQYMYKKYSENFPEETFEQDIFLPLSYCIAGRLGEAVGDTKKEHAATDMLNKILTKDFDLLI